MKAQLATVPFKPYAEVLGNKTQSSRIMYGMEDFQNEEWFVLYQSALVELEQPKMAGRIKAAKESVLARKEKLRSLPGPHSEEQHKIADALQTLSALEREMAEFDAAARRAIDAISATERERGWNKQPETDTAQVQARQPYRTREEGSTKSVRNSVKKNRREDDRPEQE